MCADDIVLMLVPMIVPMRVLVIVPIRVPIIMPMLAPMVVLAPMLTPILVPMPNMFVPTPPLVQSLQFAMGLYDLIRSGLGICVWRSPSTLV